MQIEVLNGDESWPRVEPIFEAIWPQEVRETLPWNELVFEKASRRVVVHDNGADTCHIGLFMFANA